MEFFRLLYGICDDTLNYYSENYYSKLSLFRLQLVWLLYYLRSGSKLYSGTEHDYCKYDYHINYNDIYNDNYSDNDDYDYFKHQINGTITNQRSR